MPVREGHQTLSALEIELGVQGRLPPGFRVFATRFQGKLLVMEFEYCDRHKYVSVMVDPEETQDQLIELLADQIEITPMLERPAEETIGPMIRCLGLFLEKQ